ncbi:hypothetical protein EOG37_01345 [Clavibacter michiganensis subsp. michiganensis]|uniref:hypothetical protein n=1 Tax=Clavibacter michiganensis TaxID=28447 RepID=UPI001C647E51|nr:hypothetical protein [Clavibacter michiganensis]MBW8025325.1 hypothetical protein [Clavibacter michiganensis subsp. michiganensis]
MPAAERRLAIHRWLGHDISMVIGSDYIVRFHAHDLLEALALDLAVKPTATWTYDDLVTVLGDRAQKPDAVALLGRLRHELAEYDRGIYGPVEVAASIAPEQRTDAIDMSTAAARVGDSLGRVYTGAQLREYLGQLDWIARNDARRWVPNPEQIAAGTLVVLDVAIPNQRDLYPQIHLTPDGLAAITKLALKAHQEQPA